MVTKINNFSIILLVMFVLSGCFSERYPVNIKGLTYANKLKYSNEFRIDGFYYMITGYNEFVPVIYFFDDGYYCEFTIDPSTFASLDNSDCIRIIESMREIPYNWGAYIIENDTIKVQGFDSYRGAFEKFDIQEQYATILNNSTIRFFKKTWGGGRAEMQMHDTYYFRKCILKPSSINILMQELEKERKKQLKKKS